MLVLKKMNNTDKRYAKYVKMQTMLPEGAVRQKMAADGFAPVEVDDFFANGPPAAGQAPVEPVMSAERKEKYDKMQQMLPEGAVRQKMTVDGFSPGQVYAFFTKSSSPSSSDAATDSSSNPRYAKYVKMQKMLPEGAVRQKMAADGFTVNEIDGFFETGAPADASHSLRTSFSAESSSSKRNLTYVKMLQIHSECVVRQRMAVDGASVEEIDAFFTASSSSSTSAVAPDQRYVKYELMQQIIPEAAVRQKMVVDGFSVLEVDAFFSHGAPLADSAGSPSIALTPKLAAKYSKMLTMLPLEVVRQKMSADGFTAAQMDAYFSAVTPPGPDPRFKKCSKMLEMLPAGAVRQKMVVDGFNPLEIDAFLAHGPPRAGSVLSRAAAAAVSAKRRAAYDMMLRMLPEGAVRQKMSVDGCDASQIESFFSDAQRGSNRGA